MEGQRVEALGLSALAVLAMISLIVPGPVARGITGEATHPIYGAYSSPEKTVVGNDALRVTDDAIYAKAYYSVDNEDWQEISLQGEPYHESSWLRGSAGIDRLPSRLQGAGEHYIITYSCTRLSCGPGASSQECWDCHGNEEHPEGYWQLTLINNAPPTSCDDGLLNGDETGIDCGGSCEACPLNTIYAINAGAEAYDTAQGEHYEADDHYSGGNALQRTPVDVAATADDELYYTERWGEMSYSFPVVDGSYEVTLKFMEGYADSEGVRVFDVAIEGQTVIDDLDLYATVGKNTAYDRTFTTSVSDGSLDIAFSASVNNPEIGAIIIRSAQGRASDEAQTCESHASSECYAEDSYWYDSCGVREGLKEDCSGTQRCTGGACVEDVQTAEAYEHPITIDQHYIVPEDAEQGDVVGDYTSLYTERLCNHHTGAYSFSITSGNDDGAFAIDATSGEITVADPSAITYGHDFALRVRTTVDGDQDVDTAYVHVLDKDRIRYIDSSFSGTSTGSRSAPYRNFMDSGLGNGEPGIAYLYRRDRTYLEDRMVLYNGEDDERIIIGAWGQGARPVIDGNHKNLQYMLLGTYWSTQYPDSVICNNVDVYDLDIRDYGEEGVGGHAIRTPRHGKSFNFYRIRVSGGISGNGAVYFGAADPREVFYNSSIYVQDMESVHNTGRGVKIEAGGVLVENFKDVQSTQNSPISATMTPHVTLRYIYVDDNGGLTGPNLRQYDQNVEWAYFKGLYRAIFITPTMGLPGYGPWPLNDNHVRNVIIDGTTGSSGITMENGYGANNVPENLVLDRIVVRDAQGYGVYVGIGAKNTTISYVEATGNTKGIVINPSTTGTRIHNVICYGNDGNDIENGNDGSGELINTIYGSKSGSFGSEQTNYHASSTAHFTDDDFHPSQDAPFLHAGTDLGYAYDLDNEPVSSTPSIGCYED